ncbi:MAG TPA: tRNA lysidine(34) synthetase TilS [Verrucomicrobiae bacterium]
MNEFLQRAESEIQNRNLLSRGQKILVAVSGGADSLVLLHVLHSLAAKNRWQISVAHFNHQLRGCASDADEKLVRQTAKKLSLPFYAGRADVKKIAAESKVSVEMAARKLRHEFLARLARERKISTSALAHHADDQVELFFLRLLRGAGGEGLAGMKWRSPSSADKKFTLVRPLLGFSKTEILEFTRAEKIKFRDDATNFSSDFLRNRIRNELLPLLQKNYQPGLTKTVLRLMEITGAESEFVGEAARLWIRRRRGDESQIKNGKLETPHVVSYKFTELPVAVQRKVLQQQLVAAGVAADFDLIEQLRVSAEKFVSVSSALSVARDARGKIRLANLKEHFGEKFKVDELKLKLSGGAGRAEFGGKKFVWKIQPQKSFVRPQKKTGAEFFDADKIGGEIILRHWRAGDRFQPIGLQSAVKLQDLFVNAKIPSARRRNLVLAATAAGEVFWVEGLRIAEQFKLAPETRRQLVWNQSKIAA